MSSANTTIALVIAIAVIAYLMKVFTRGSEPKSAREPDEVDRVIAEVSGVDPEDAADVAARTSDGWALVPDRDDVRFIPPREREEMGEMPSHIDRGDFTAARVVRGAPDFDPWRLEVLGRDGEYRAWFFETEDGAEAALDLFQRRIVVPPRDEYGEPAPPTDADFDEARRLDEETERLLDHPDE